MEEARSGPIPPGPTRCSTPLYSLAPSSQYKWEVIAEDASGQRRLSRETRNLHTVEIVEVEPVTDAAAGMRLDLRVGPNPFADEVQFAPVLANRGSSSVDPSSATWSWSIYDPQGRRLARARSALPLDHGDVWDGTDAAGREAPAGVYYLEAASGSVTTRRVLVRMR